MSKLTLCILILCAVTFAPLASSFVRPSNAQTVRAAFKKWSAGRGSIFDLMADDAVIIIPGTAPHCGTFRKSIFVKDIATPFTARFSKQPTPRALKIWSAGNDVAVLAEAEGTTRDGRLYANHYVFVLAMHGGRIARLTEFLDMAAFNDVWDRVEPAPVGRASVR